MSQFLSKHYSLGKTAASGENEHLLGQVSIHKDVDYASTERIKPELSAMNVVARWVKNESGGTLNPGESCTWDTGSTFGPGKAVGGEGAAGSVCGFVDPYVSSVANDQCFWLIEEGPTKVCYDGSASLAINDPLATAASGRVAEATLGTTETAYVIGRALEAKSAGSADDLFRAYVQKPIF